MKTALVSLLALAALSTHAAAGKVTEKWMAEATEMRGGREYRTLLTYVFSGTQTFNGRPEYHTTILCEARDPATGRIETVEDSGPSSLGQGIYGGVGTKVGEFSLDEGYDFPEEKKPGRLEVSDRRCASGVPKIVRILEQPRAKATATAQAGRAPRVLGNNGKKFDGYTWLHNGSEMLMDEGFGEIRYDKPKASIAKAVRPGDVLFRGVFRKDGTVEGTA